ncbi:MAG: hypothetical protein Alpg2KO_28820 [Alphaproteobacteria bacterium]
MTNVELANFEFTDEYARQIEENMQAKAAVERAKQDAERANFEKQRDITKAQGEKESAILKAQGAAESTRLAADAEAHAIRERGGAEADAIRERAEALGDNPLLVELEKAQRWQGGVPTTVVGGDDATPIINLDNGNGNRVTPVPGK